MHTPAGYEIKDGIFYVADWLQVIFNPSFPYRFAHMVLAAYTTTAFVVVGVAAFQLIRNQSTEEAMVMLKMGLVFVCIVVPLQIFAGHEQGINVHEWQPIKLAAMEGHWETHKGAPMVLFALPNEEEEANDYELAIPKLGSLVVAHDIHAEIKGLKEWPASERPPVAMVFWSFRIMVGLGLVMLFTGYYGAWLLYKRRIEYSDRFLKFCALMGPSGFIAIIAGWFTAEVGRQPYTVYGLLRTAESVSPVTANGVGLSLAVFIFAYTVVFSSGIYYISRLIIKGPETSAQTDEDLRSEAVLATRLDLGDYEHSVRHPS